MRSVLRKTRYSNYSIVVQTLEGSIIDHYQIQQRLARGGMSDIYLACDIRTKQTVALKLVHKSNHGHYARLQREIKALRILAHENILPVLAYGKDGAWCYMAIPYIEAGTLAKRLAQGPLTEEEASNILKQLANALQFVHRHGMIHCDIKPANILLDKGQHVYLIDFGLVQLQKESARLTHKSMIPGTPDYMAPELTDEPATTSSDVYALGILLYQMLTGRVPFKGEHPIATIWKHRTEQPEPPSLHNPAIAPAVERVILHAIEKKPQQRFQSVSEFAQAYLCAIGDDEPLLVEANVAPISYYSGQMRRNPSIATGVLAAACVALMSLSLGFSFSTFQINSRHQIAQAAQAQTHIANHITNKALLTIPKQAPTQPPAPTHPTPIPIATFTPATNVTMASNVNAQSPLLISQPTLAPGHEQNDNAKQSNSDSHGDHENCDEHSHDEDEDNE